MEKGYKVDGGERRVRRKGGQRDKVLRVEMGVR